jgi:hypothetical protein
MMLRDRQLANFFAFRSLPLRFALRSSLLRSLPTSCDARKKPFMLAIPPGRHATPDLISRLEKLDRESLVSNPLSVQKVDYAVIRLFPVTNGNVSRFHQREHFISCFEFHLFH